MAWMRLATEAECPPGHCIERVAGDRMVALFNVQGVFYALDGVCPHQGGPLGKGQLQGCVVTCPWHGWQFDVRSGTCLLSAAIQQPVLPTKQQDGIVCVNLELNAGA